MDICKARWFLYLFVLGSPCVELPFREIEIGTKLLILWAALSVFLQDELVGLEKIANDGLCFCGGTGLRVVELKTEEYAFGRFSCYGVHIGLMDERKTCVLCAAHEVLLR